MGTIQFNVKLWQEKPKHLPAAAAYQDQYNIFKYIWQIWKGQDSIMRW